MPFNYNRKNSRWIEEQEKNITTWGEKNAKGDNATKKKTQDQ